MNNFLAVRVAQRRQQLGHDAEGLLQRVHPAFVQVMLEVIALDKLHHQKGHVAVAIRVVNADDIGVLQAGS